MSGGFDDLIKIVIVLYSVGIIIGIFLAYKFWKRYNNIHWILKSLISIFIIWISCMVFLQILMIIGQLSSTK